MKYADLRKLRNLPYAAHGYVFKDQGLRDYFATLLYPLGNKPFKESDFSENSRKLISEVTRLEARMTGRRSRTQSAHPPSPVPQPPGNTARKSDSLAASNNQDVMRVPDGITVEVWAQSPLFYNPTNMDVNLKGRIWVTEANRLGNVAYRSGKKIQ